MANSKDGGKPSQPTVYDLVRDADKMTPTFKGVEVEGNSDAKILAKVFEEFSKNGLTMSERVTIAKMDDLLKDANIIISKTGDKATITQEDGKAFDVKSKGRIK